MPGSVQRGHEDLRYAGRSSSCMLGRLSGGWRVNRGLDFDVGDRLFRLVNAHHVDGTVISSP